MGNAVEDALSRASAEQRARAYQAIEEARRNIKLVSMREEITPSDADKIAQNAKTIEEARQAIPYETMKDVDEVTSPPPTPTQNEHANSKVVDLHPDTQETIEQVEQGEGNNYLRENAVDRALERPSQEVPPNEQQQVMGR